MALGSHPVPQNIIEVEFKLFGAFTLKQFMKMLFGCLGGVFIFLLGLPWYIGLPLMATSVLLGIGMAIIPNLGVWISTFVKAMFIAPRYVWIKESSTPNALKNTKKVSAKNNQQVEKTRNARKVDLTEISLSKLLATRGDYSRQRNELLDLNTPEKVQNNQARDVNINRAFSEEFQQQAQPTAQSAATPSTSAQTLKLETKEDYLNEIERLKSELNILVQNKTDQAREKELMDKINVLTQHLQVITQSESLSQPATGIVRDFQGNQISNGQIIFGVLVDNEDKPIKNAEIEFKNVETGNKVKIKVNEDGRFTSAEKIMRGTYDVKIDGKGHKFHTYKIQIGDSKLPAYKFRSK